MAKKAKPKPPKIYRALLDQNGVYQGLELVRGQARATDVIVPGDCDLEPGRYRWDGSTFLPLPKFIEAAELVEEPATLAAIAAGFNAVEEKFPGTLPAITRRWLDWFKTTVDAKGRHIGGN